MLNRVEFHFDLKVKSKSVDEARDLVEEFVHRLREFGVPGIVAASWQTSQDGGEEWHTVPL